jgi:hypothetical protein
LDAAIPIENPTLRERFESRRATDVDAILERIDQVEVERAYRIIGVLEQTARAIEEQLVPTLREARRRWKRRVLWLDSLVFGTIGVGLLAASIWAGYWQGLTFSAPWMTWLSEHLIVLGLFAATILVAAGYVHFRLRRLAANGVAAAMRKLDYDGDMKEWLQHAFAQNTQNWQPLFGVEPSGWSSGTRKRLAQVLGEADSYVQSLNSRFTDPSGHSKPRHGKRGESQAKPAPSRATGTAASQEASVAPAEIAAEADGETAIVVKPPADFVPDAGRQR